VANGKTGGDRLGIVLWERRWIELHSIPETSAVITRLAGTASRVYFHTVTVAAYGTVNFACGFLVVHKTMILSASRKGLRMPQQPQVRPHHLLACTLPIFTHQLCLGHPCDIGHGPRISSNLLLDRLNHNFDT
jgi:hypothetical protein